MRTNPEHLKFSVVTIGNAQIQVVTEVKVSYLKCSSPVEEMVVRDVSSWFIDDDPPPIERAYEFTFVLPADFKSNNAVFEQFRAYRVDPREVAERCLRALHR